MKKSVSFLALLVFGLTSFSAFSKDSRAECYNYSIENYNKMNSILSFPMGNAIRIESDIVDGKDRMVFFSGKNNSTNRNVFLGTAQINEDGFSFEGFDTVSYDKVVATMVNGKVLSLEIGNYKIQRHINILSAETVAGQKCRQGLHPEDLFR